MVHPYIMKQRPGCLSIFLFSCLVWGLRDKIQVDSSWVSMEGLRRTFLKYQVTMPVRWATVDREFERNIPHRIEFTNRKQSMENQDNLPFWTPNAEKGSSLKVIWNSGTQSLLVKNYCSRHWWKFWALSSEYQISLHKAYINFYNFTYTIWSFTNSFLYSVLRNSGLIPRWWK